MQRRHFLASALILALAGGGLPGAARSAPRAFSLAVVSDFHMDLPKLKNAFGDAAVMNAAAMVFVGDSCDGQAQEYASILGALRTTPHPANLFFTMGNHEYYAGYHPNGGDYDETGFPNGETSAACRERFNRFRGADPQGPVYYDTWVQGCHLIFLGGERSRMDDPTYLDNAYLTPAQLSWLEARMKAPVAPGKPVLVFLHQPFPDTVSGSGHDSSILQDAALRAILRRHPGTLFFSGHTHWELGLPTTHHEDAQGALHCFNTSSLRDPYNTKDEPIQKDMSEGLILEIQPGKVVVRGRDFLGHAYLQGQRYVVKVH